MKHSFIALIFVAEAMATVAPETTEFVPLQDRAQGRSLIGASLLNDSLYKNPAASAFTQVYAVDAAFLFPKALAVSILDTRTSPVGGALGYFRRPIAGREGNLEGVKLALSTKASDWLGIGVGVKSLWGPSVQGETARLMDVDVGVLARYSALNVGLTVGNLLGGETKIEQHQEWGLGARIGWQETLFLSLATRARAPEVRPYQYGIGAEYISPYYFSLKGGYYVSRHGAETFKPYWSAGASFLSPRLSLHYAVEIPANGDVADHVIGATLLM